jgi:CheY-like chemotaxis protein
MSNKPKTILVVDDFLEMRELFKDILSFNGYLVSIAENGKKAIELYKENPFDLVVLDLFLPDINGIEVMQNLVTEFPKIKIIAISGGGEEYQLEFDRFLKKANHNGAKKSLKKPCDPEVFLKAVMDVLAE